MFNYYTEKEGKLANKAGNVHNVITLWCIRPTIAAYSECVFAALDIQHATHVPYCHLWPVRLYSTLPLYLTNKMIFKKKSY